MSLALTKGARVKQIEGKLRMEIQQGLRISKLMRQNSLELFDSIRLPRRCESCNKVYYVPRMVYPTGVPTGKTDGICRPCLHKKYLDQSKAIIAARIKLSLEREQNNS